MSKQPFLGTVWAATVNWRVVGRNIAIAVAAGLLIFIAVMIRQKIVVAETRATEVSAQAEKARTEAAEARAEAREWRTASKEQTDAIRQMSVKFETMTKAQVVRDREWSQKWATTEKALSGLQAQAQALVDAPAAPPDLEIPTARAKLKDTKGYRLQ